MKRFWSLRPKRKSAKNWRFGVLTGNDRGAVIYIEWIAPGYTAVSFWTAPNRLSWGLEDRSRCKVQTHTTLAGPIESE